MCEVSSRAVVWVRRQRQRRCGMGLGLEWGGRRRPLRKQRKGQDRQRAGGKGRRDSGMCVYVCVCVGICVCVSVCSRVVLQLAGLETDVVVFLPSPLFRHSDVLGVALLPKQSRLLASIGCLSDSSATW